MGIVAAGLGTTTLVTNGPAWADAATPPNRINPANDSKECQYRAPAKELESSGN